MAVKVVKGKKRRMEDSPGPKSQYLKIEGDWREAVKRLIQKKKPAEGWPK